MLPAFQTTVSQRYAWCSHFMEWQHTYIDISFGATGPRLQRHGFQNCRSIIHSPLMPCTWWEQVGTPSCICKKLTTSCDSEHAFIPHMWHHLFDLCFYVFVWETKRIRRAFCFAYLIGLCTCQVRHTVRTTIELACAMWMWRKACMRTKECWSRSSAYPNVLVTRSISSVSSVSQLCSQSTCVRCISDLPGCVY